MHRIHVAKVALDYGGDVTLSKWVGMIHAFLEVCDFVKKH